MSTPACPTHGTSKMRQGQDGGWFCATKVPENPKGWCKFHVSAPKAGKTNVSAAVSAAASTAALGAAPTPNPNSGDHRYIAALEFAAVLYRGMGPDLRDDALAFARRVYESFPG